MPEYQVNLIRGTNFDQATPVRGTVNVRDGKAFAQSPNLFDNLSISNGLPFYIVPTST